MKILFTAEHDPAMFDEINALGEIIKAGGALGGDRLPQEELIKLAEGVDMIITTFDDITKPVMDVAPNLKLIVCTRATPVNIDTAYAKERGIPVIYTPGRNSDSAAEMTVMLMMLCAKNVHAAYRAMHNGQFLGAPDAVKNINAGLKEDVIWGTGPGSPYEVFKGFDLRGKTLGIIGYGSIGRRVGEIAKGFGMNLLIFDPYVSEVDVDTKGLQKKVDLDELLKNADLVSCHLKVTESTTGLMNAERFAMMKPTAYFVNTSRAAVVDEPALIEAIRAGTIAGAGLDVFAKEPLPSDHPFLHDLADRVAMTPHIGGATLNATTNHTIMFLSDVKRFLKGEHMLYQYRG